jgi:hypothetical protein
VRHFRYVICAADISIGGTPVGRVKMELFADICPKVKGQGTPELSELSWQSLSDWMPLL